MEISFWPRLYGEKLSYVQGSPACPSYPPGEPILHTFPYKSWQNVHLRNKKMKIPAQRSYLMFI